MINENDNVKLNGSVSATGTGTFTLLINEFFVDGAWHTLKEPKEFEISVEDYTNKFTSDELSYINKMAKKDSKSTTLCKDELEVVNSIVKKLEKSASID